MDAGIWASRVNDRGSYALKERSIEHEREGMGIRTQRGQCFQVEERQIGTRGTPCRLHLLYTSSRAFVKSSRAHPRPYLRAFE